MENLCEPTVANTLNSCKSLQNSTNDIQKAVVETETMQDLQKLVFLLEKSTN